MKSTSRIEVIREYFKKISPIHNFLRKLRIIFLSLIDIFYYAPLAIHTNLFEQEKFDKDYDVIVSFTNMKKQKKYDQVFPYIEKGMKIIDIASGGGEAQAFMEERFGNKFIKYMGIDHDNNRVKAGRSIGHDIQLLDCSNLTLLEKFIIDNGPWDLILCLYSFYFFREPEAFLQMIHGKAPKVFLGCYNMGHWSYRLRMVFGRAPCPSPTHYYTKPQTNYAEMQRFWTRKDHEFIFRSLNYKFLLIGTKSDLTSVHSKPNKFYFPSLTAKSFIYLLEPLADSNKRKNA